jgi:hypothetical protein
MWRRLLTGIACAAILLISAAAASARPDTFTARVSGLPEVQQVGRSYFFTITVRNRGAWIKNFCIDFEDDNNSWLIKMPGLNSRKDDTFCIKMLRGGTRKFTARLVPAKTGQHKLQVILGKATLFSATNAAVIDDPKALEWSEDFVIVG